MDRQQVIQIIRDRAAAHGVDPAVMVANAGIESNYDPSNVHPKTGAAGLFQFMPGQNASWAQYGLGKDPLDPEANADAAARMMQDNSGVFRRKMNRDPTPGEQYLLWQQGATGGTALLNNPDRRAIDVLRPFYKPGVAEQAITGNGGRLDMTAGEFANKWINDANARYSKIGGSPSFGSLNATPQTGQNASTAVSPAAGDTGASGNVATAQLGALDIAALTQHSDNQDAADMKAIQSAFQMTQQQAPQVPPLQPMPMAIPANVARGRLMSAIRSPMGK